MGTLRKIPSSSASGKKSRQREDPLVQTTVASAHVAKAATNCTPRIKANRVAVRDQMQGFFYRDQKRGTEKRKRQKNEGINPPSTILPLYLVTILLRRDMGLSPRICST